MKQTLLLTILILSFSAFAFGQNVADEKPYIISSNSSGEEHSAMTDSLLSKVYQTNERLFVIVRLGTHDTNRNINQARLSGLRDYLLLGRRFDSRHLVFAIGERVKGEGRIEYYLGSQLRLITFAHKNRIPNYTCC